MAQRIGVYAGSFDPVTNGHLDVIMRSTKLFDKVIVAILRNEKKKGLFAPETRKALLDQAIEGTPCVETCVFDGLLVDLMQQKGASVIIRGLRSAEEFQAEWQMAQLNKMMDPRIETIFLPCTPEMSFISSSAAKEIASFGGDFHALVPPASYEALQNAFPKDSKQ